MSDTLTRLAASLADRYRIERELGQGGMATVYLADDLKHDRKVAIKVLHPELSAVIGGDRFLAEIKVTANLQHPHILGLIDSGEADGLLYYVMPFVAGESLRAPPRPREAASRSTTRIRLAREVADALDYAHRQGVVHRDIKPENILLQDGQALVADFGIALAVQQAGGSRMTQTGMSLGTPAYMSPEQAMGERDIDARSDVYALGAMTYEMLAGEPPFTGPNSQAIVAKVLTETPPPLRPKRPTVSPAVEHAVLTSLQKLPADRFGTAKDFADALDGKGGTTPRRWRSRPPASSRPSRLSRPVMLAAVALHRDRRGRRRLARCAAARAPRRFPRATSSTCPVCSAPTSATVDRPSRSRRTGAGSATSGSPVLACAQSGFWSSRLASPASWRAPRALTPCSSALTAVRSPTSPREAVSRSVRRGPARRARGLDVARPCHRRLAPRWHPAGERWHLRPPLRAGRRWSGDGGGPGAQ